MKNRFGSTAPLLLGMVVLLVMPGVLTAQTQQEAPYTIDALLSGDVQAVSARIATLYGADAQVVERYVQAAINLESRTGIAAPVVIAIAIHESSFKSELFVNGGNPFGIKASKPWVGPTYSKWQDGVETKYRLYASPEEAIWDLSNFVKSRTWYADALNCPIDDARCVIDGLKRTEQEPGYSTDPKWDEAILNIIQKVGLQALVTR